MSKNRHRTYKTKNFGLSPNQMHVLVGLILGRRIGIQEYKRRYACSSNKKDSLTWIQKNVIESLISSNLIQKDFKKKMFIFTAKGFEIALTRIRRSKIQACTVDDKKNNVCEIPKALDTQITNDFMSTGKEDKFGREIRET
jgi:hypothetical protein